MITIGIIIGFTGACIIAGGIVVAASFLKLAIDGIIKAEQKKKNQ